MSEIIHLVVTGMTCGGCENAVKRALRQAPGVEHVEASHRDSRVDVTFDPAQVAVEALRGKIASLGYSVAP
jgi:copper chaperone